MGRPRRRCAHQRRHVVEAAEHAVERDDVGRWDVWRELDEVAMLEVDAIAQAAPLRLITRHIEIGR